MTEVHRCTQCGRAMSTMDWIIGPVCGKCCRKNHAEATGRSAPRKKSRKRK